MRSSQAGEHAVATWFSRSGTSVCASRRSTGPWSLALRKGWRRTLGPRPAKAGQRGLERRFDGQAEKGTWWMPWRQEAKKGAGACDTLWGAGKQAMNQRCPNGETRPPSSAVTASAGPTRGTETSQYPQERKSNETPQVVASERGIAQTSTGFCRGVVGPAYECRMASGSFWEGAAQRVTPPYTKA